jgi:hypothetical protein
MLVALVPAAGAIFTEDFSEPPGDWELWNPGAFRWDETAGNLAVTWDSRETNAFFYHKLPFALTRQDAFAVEFTLRLEDVQVGINPGQNSTFPLCVGFLNMADATRTNFFRGSGVNATTGPRSIVEFSYFPDDGFIDATIGPIIASTNNQIAVSHTHPVELTPGEIYRIKMAFDPVAQILSTTILHESAAYGGPIRPLNYTTNFGDFRVDRFSINNYSDAGQSPPQFAGSLLAHGVVDDVVITFPEPPVSNIAMSRSGNAWVVTFTARAGWKYTLERATDFLSWEQITSQSGTDGVLELRDETASTQSFYRVRADRL